MASFRWGAVFAVWVVMVSVVAAHLHADAPADEAKKLEGTWTVTSATSEGKALEDAKDGQWTFSGDKLTIKTPNQKEERLTFKVDPTKKPKTMDWEFVEKQPNVFPATVIYELDGDNLKLALGGPVRPTEFTDQDRHRLYTLKRKK